MSRIKILPDKIINLIAAGEVVDRPSSVVKELIENSVDACATQITVETKGDGRQLIKIIDNGVGMTEEDALLAFQRHATSKISSVEDLDRITTMGFRGEGDFRRITARSLRGSKPLTSTAMRTPSWVWAVRT